MLIEREPGRPLTDEGVQSEGKPIHTGVLKQGSTYPGFPHGGN